MKIAVAGKGGVGKTTVCAWFADYLSRQGKDVLLIDADSNATLGLALGFSEKQLPTPISEELDLINSRVGSGIINLNPKVEDIPEKYSVKKDNIKLLVLGGIKAAGSGCSCNANAFLKALLAHVVLERDEIILVDLEGGIEHLGRGTVEGMDALIVVSEPTVVSFKTAKNISLMASELGLTKKFLIFNKVNHNNLKFDVSGYFNSVSFIDFLPDLVSSSVSNSCILDIDQRKVCDPVFSDIFKFMNKED
ncbi:Cobyrinic acid ac-diamide synthase [Thermodesulfobium narugense DSM 14796]|uniref:Cobyrinic acid ac-diamide synthase n=1 Tax=Thermodesulfobium narugense DSM 14796 TaxID=747365 RepID=M1E431_9BACT|nr:AAA family ATPase [Thermodesulfobium narugense]AEE13687.1 Cobyrinic acid ac-diamide synthase [Thermodesulfobium narugense DSM 14796]